MTLICFVFLVRPQKMTSILGKRKYADPETPEEKKELLELANRIAAEDQMMGWIKKAESVLQELYAVKVGLQSKSIREDDIHNCTVFLEQDQWRDVCKRMAWLCGSFYMTVATDEASDGFRVTDLDRCAIQNCRKREVAHCGLAFVLETACGSGLKTNFRAHLFDVKHLWESGSEDIPLCRTHSNQFSSLTNTWRDEHPPIDSLVVKKEQQMRRLSLPFLLMLYVTDRISPLANLIMEYDS
jgi:hypothetical protein